jgi:hypothetical protein
MYWSWFHVLLIVNRLPVWKGRVTERKRSLLIMMCVGYLQQKSHRVNLPVYSTPVLRWHVSMSPVVHSGLGKQLNHIPVKNLQDCAASWAESLLAQFYIRHDTIHVSPKRYPTSHKDIFGSTHLSARVLNILSTLGCQTCCSQSLLLNLLYIIFKWPQSWALKIYYTLRRS